jgi:hypothetical protein
VGSGSIDPDLRINNGSPPRPDKVCGAMSEQHGDGGHGHISAPQKFVHLIGCLDPKARTAAGVRPRPMPPKR